MTRSSTSAIDRRDRDRGQRGHCRRDVHRQAHHRQREGGHGRTTQPLTDRRRRRRTTQPRSGTLTFAAGETTKTIDRARQRRQPQRARRDVHASKLDDAVNANIADATGVGTITDDDALPALTIADVTVAEGDTGTTDAVFAVTLSPASGRPVTVNYATANAGATGGDYVATSGQLSSRPVRRARRSRCR